MVKKKKKGITIVELMIVTAILVIVIAVVYPFFNTNLKTINSTQVKENLQEQGQKAVSLITDKALESSSIEELLDLSSNDKLDSNTKVAFSRLLLKSGENICYAFEVREGKLYYGKTTNGTAPIASIEIARNIAAIEISPVPEASTFKVSKGLILNINLKEKNIKVNNIKTQIYFRNYEK